MCLKEMQHRFKELSVVGVLSVPVRFLPGDIGDKKRSRYRRFDGEAQIERTPIPVRIPKVMGGDRAAHPKNQKRDEKRRRLECGVPLPYARAERDFFHDSARRISSSRVSMCARSSEISPLVATLPRISRISATSCSIFVRVAEVMRSLWPFCWVAVVTKCLRNQVMLASNEWAACMASYCAAAVVF